MQLNWKVAAGVVGLVIVALLALRLTRHVAPYQPPEDRQLADWGTVDPTIAARLQSILDEQVNALRVPGLQAHVRASGGQTWSGVSGSIDLGRRTPLRREHILRVGSTTKTLTAVVILRLVEGGHLSLDDPLSRWFPEFPNADSATVRQLLNHTSGIPDVLASSEVLMKSILPSTYWTQAELLDIVARSASFSVPGAEWRYSNTNYILLGLIAEQITGQPFAALLRRDLLDPLALTNTYFIPYEPSPASLVAGFDRDLSRFPGMLDIGVSDTSWPTAAFTSGALASTADDLGAFYHSLFAGELLSPASMAEMTTFVDAPNPGFDEQDGYGLGLMRIHAGGTEFIGHVGQFMGSTAVAMYAPDGGELITITVNLSYPNLIPVLAAMLQALR